MAAKKEVPEASSENKRPKKKWKIVLIIILLLLLAGGGAAAFWFFQMRSQTPNLPQPASSGATSAQTSVQESGAYAAVVDPAASTPTDMPRPSVNMVDLPTVNVNLSDAAGDKYLKIGMEVEVSAPEAVTEIQLQQAKIRDALIILLSSKTYLDLSTPEGKMQLKNEIAARLNQILGVPRVVRIYYTEFVVN